MKVRIVLVRPEHDLNVGSVCRAMKNFGFCELWIVSPKCRLGFEAKKFAKHSEDVLESARVVKALCEAVEGCDAVIGTTGVTNRFRGRLFKNCIPVSGLYAKICKLGSVAIVFGSESTGLGEEEINACDVMATIPTAPQHRVLNLSHSVAVVLYQLSLDKARKKPASATRLYAPAPKQSLEKLQELFLDAVRSSPTVRDKKKVAMAFNRVVRRALPSREEVSTLLCALDSFAGAEKERKKKKGGFVA